MFPFELKLAQTYLEPAAMQWQRLGRALDIQESVLERIEHDHPSDPAECSRLMIREWLNSPHLHPCWYYLVQALHKLEMDYIAEKILENHGNLSLHQLLLLCLYIVSFPTLDVHTELQKQLLDGSNANAAVDDVSLLMLSDIAGTKWPYLTSFLPFTRTEIKEAKGGKKPLLFLLTEWKERVHATYGDLLDIMSTLYLQTQRPALMIDRPSPESTHNSSKLVVHNSRCKLMQG